MLTSPSMVSEERLDLLRLMAFGFEQQETLAGILQPDSRMLYANRTALDAVGATLDEVVGLPFRDTPWRRHSEESRRLGDHLLERALQGERAVVEDTIINKAGQTIPVLMSISPVYDESGSIVALIPEGKIISDLKHLQSKLERERWEMRQWLDSLVSYVIRCTPRGEIIFCNKPLLHALGLEEQEIVGTNFLHLRWPGNNQENRQKMKRAFSKARKGEKSTIEICYTQSGSNRNTVLMSVSPIFDKNGKVSFLAAEAKNISEQVWMREALIDKERDLALRLEAEVDKATEALRETAQFNEKLVNTVPMGIVLLDEQDRIAFVNPEMGEKFRTAELSIEEVTGRLLADLPLYPESGASEEKLPGLQQLLAGRRALSRLVLRPKSDACIVFETATAPVTDSDGRRKGTVLIMNDVTRRNRLEAELYRTRIQSETLSSLGKLVSGVAHEINNPLTSIIGCAEYLAESQLVDAKAREAAELIAFEAKRSGKIVRNLLAFARQSHGKKTLVDMNEVARTVLGLHAHRLRDWGIEAMLDLSECAATAWANAAQMHQVILNLINNAEDAIRGSSTGSRIVLRTRVRDSRIHVEVEDDGPGIPEEFLPKVFDPFFTTKEVGQGTGLGLSLCYGIIHEHRGNIDAQTLYPHGARLTLLLPFSSDEAEAAASAPKTPPWLPATVLVVDDEANICRVLSDYLERLGCTVHTAATGEDALARVRRGRYDVLLVDVKMPTLDGVDLYRVLEQEHPSAAACTILMTGTQEDRLMDLLQTRRVPVLPKPFARQDLLAAFAEIRKQHAGTNPARSGG